MTTENSSMNLIRQVKNYAGEHELNLYLLRSGRIEIGFLITIINPDRQGVYLTRFGQRLMQINDLYDYLVANEARVYNSFAFGDLVDEFFTNQ